MPESFTMVRALVAAAMLAVAAATAAAGELRITLTNGDTLTARVIQEDAATVTVSHPVLGRITIPRTSIASIALAPKPAAPADGEVDPVTDTIEQAEPTPAESTAEEIIAEGDTTGDDITGPDWEVSLDLSLTSVTGNTDEQSLRFGFNAGFETEEAKFVSDLSYYFKQSDGATTDNKLTTGVQYDWLDTDSPWFWFGSSRFDYDQFESWEQRIAAHTGPGYRFLQDVPDMTLSVRAGPGVRREFGSENDQARFEGVFGFDYSWRYTRRQSFDVTFRYFPVLTDFTSDYRLRSGANWRLLIDEDWNLSLLIGFTHEYQNIVSPGNDPNDLRIFTGLQYSF